jgi:hypothetical protein
MLIPPPKDPKKIKITRETFFGENPDIDKEFKEFLEFLEIEMRIVESEGEWPLVEYEGNPYDIKIVLLSRFGMGEGDIKGEYPQLFED